MKVALNWGSPKAGTLRLRGKGLRSRATHREYYLKLFKNASHYGSVKTSPLRIHQPTRMRYPSIVDCRDSSSQQGGAVLHSISDTPQPSSAAEELARDIMSVLRNGPEGDSQPFESLALRVFAHQFENNQPYRDFCTAADVSPGSIRSHIEVPAYPTSAFKSEIVTSFPFSEAVQSNITSGTSSPNERGRIFRDKLGLELVLEANRIVTESYIFPDFQQGQRCRILILAPSPKTAPSMGMAIGMEATRKLFGTPDSMFLVDRGGVDVKGLVDALSHSEASGVPVALIGATSAYVYFLSRCQKKSLRFALPAGSRLSDGGGYRGRFGEMTRDQYYELVQDVLGVPSTHCVNMLGMAESGTNYADDSLRKWHHGETGVRHKAIPAWCRVYAVSPMTGEVLPHGEVGLLKHYDLVNLPAVLGVQTDNLGYTDESGGFEIIGRAQVVDGKVAELPSDHAVGPMGDSRIFRLLEGYMNFSIDFKMGRIKGQGKKAP